MRVWCFFVVIVNNDDCVVIELYIDFGFVEINVDIFFLLSVNKYGIEIID